MINIHHRCHPSHLMYHDHYRLYVELTMHYHCTPTPTALVLMMTVAIAQIVDYLLSAAEMTVHLMMLSVLTAVGMYS